MTPETLNKLMRAYPVQELASGNIRTCPVRLSYPNLFKAVQQTDKKGAPRGEPKFSTALLFPKGADVARLSEAFKHTAIEKFGPKAGAMALKMPFRDQGSKVDREGNLSTGYEEGGLFFNCSSTQKPGIVDAFGSPITDESKVYAGVWALVTVRPFAFEGEQRGVGVGLQNVQIIADGERIGGGRASADSEFGPLDASLLAEFDAPAGNATADLSRWD